MNAQSYEKPKGGKQGPPIISGNVPGILDPTQPSRLLRVPGSTLSFASFDPLAASQLHISDLNMNKERCRLKRIVIETFPNGPSYWRWVPNARKEEGVEEEGSFDSRIVDICGTPYKMSQEQWDIYKLDPKYDCFVKCDTAFPVISVKQCSGFEAPLSTSIPRWQSEMDSSTTAVSDDDSERMIVDDDDTPFNPLPTKPLPRNKRRSSPRTPHHFDFSTNQLNSNTSPGESSKRPRDHPSFQTLRPTDEEETIHFAEDHINRNTKFYTPKIQKRARTLSPGAKQRNLYTSKSGREKAKHRRWEQLKQTRREQKENQFLREVFSEVPPAFASNNADYSAFADIPEEDEASMADDTEPSTHHTTPANEEELENQRLADSLKKMAELNSDRQRQREREMRERGEELGSRRAQTEGVYGEDEKKRKKFEDEMKRKQKLEEARRKEEARRCREQQLEREKQERLRHELLEGLAREREIRHSEWNTSPWTHVKAIERYKRLSGFFDKAKFSERQFPLVHFDIPWPTLRHPTQNRPQDMDWESVTQFFETAKIFIRGQAYRDFLNASRHRFHPDRWSNRKLWSAILDEQDRNEVITGVNAVSQAINSLYESSKTD